jgi:hypothetical protein
MIFRQIFFYDATVREKPVGLMTLKMIERQGCDYVQATWESNMVLVFSISKI